MCCFMDIIVVRTDAALNSQIDRSIPNELLVPITARRHYLRANAAVARGEYKAAILDFERATELYFRAGDEGARVEYALGLLDCCMGRAQAHYALGELNEAVEYYSGSEVMFSALDFFGENPVALTTRAKCLVGRGSARAALHSYASAVDDFGRAIKIYLSVRQEQSKREQTDLMLADCMIRRGNVYRGLLDRRESVRDYSNAISLCGRISQSDTQDSWFLLLARAYINRSVAHAVEGEFILAFLDFESARSCLIQHAVIAMDRLRERSMQLLSPFRSLVRPDAGRWENGEGVIKNR